ncbi:hypothetical protein [Peribacillus frigoritolerans]|uniref:hypothetical protein n=1 Tax=Peribacillus frigoritolerans TaxID=450367 RepID=UPI00301A946D
MSEQRAKQMISLLEDLHNKEKQIGQALSILSGKVTDGSLYLEIKQLERLIVLELGGDDAVWDFILGTEHFLDFGEGKINDFGLTRRIENIITAYKNGEIKGENKHVK